MIKRLTSAYTYIFPETITYMLQSTEYDVAAYISWLYRVNDFRKVMQRKSINRTMVAKLFLALMRVGMIAQLLIGYGLLLYAITIADTILICISALLVLTTPFLWAHLIVIPLVFAKRFYIIPQAKNMNAQTKNIFRSHEGIKIAVAGSYGKTTLKELLSTVLAEGLNVASTPGNKNVASAHNAFAKSLNGKEDVLIVEFGEGKPGDVQGFSEVIKPNIAVVTGLAPAHLDQYGTIEQAGKDIFSVADVAGPRNTYINNDSLATRDFIPENSISFSSSGLDGWRVKDCTIGINGTHFMLHKASKIIHVRSSLIGEHLIGVLATTAVIADRLGLSIKQIEAGFSKTVPYEHRMQPYRLSGAWIIDDTYNGNIEGVRSGLTLLRTLHAKRKIYVTPGLVEQGGDSDVIHHEIGKMIAAASPDIVVLMNNSTTEHITDGLLDSGYKGEITVQKDPLRFYTSLDQFVASGDVVLMQNDWTDNYA